MNLTAVTDPAEALVKHVEDSLSLLPVMEAALGDHDGRDRDRDRDDQDIHINHEHEHEHEHDPAGSATTSRTSRTSRTTRKVRLLDVGTGGGIPAALLAIARPEWEVVGLDTLKKRCDFVREAAMEVWCGCGLVWYGILGSRVVVTGTIYYA